MSLWPFARIPELQHRYGRLAPVPVDVGDLTHYATEPLPAPPVALPAPVLAYAMALNDQISDCTIAEVVHVDQVTAALAHQPWAYPGDPNVRAAYFKLTGGQDTGLVETTVLKAWSAPGGLFNDQLAAFAPINVKHLPVIKQTVWLCGAVYAGVLVSRAQELQFARGQTWKLTGKPIDWAIVGGHAVPIVGYNQTGPIIVTWGRLVQCTWQWWLTYAEEAYAIITSQVKAAGRLRQIALPALEADIQLLHAA